MQSKDDQHPKQRGREGGLPRDRNSKDNIEDGLDTEGNNRDRVQIGFGGPTGFGRKRIGKAAHWLTDIVFPAGSQERSQQREPQVGGDMGDRIAHLLLGEEDKRRL